MKKSLLLLFIPLLAVGCTHTLRITKGPVTPPVVTRPASPVRVGFRSIGSDRLLQGAIWTVEADAAIADAREDYKTGGDFRPDYICTLSQKTGFASSGENFSITFPGFFVFRPARFGYQYTADITTQLSLLDTRSKQASQTTFQAPYEFRYCSFGHGASANWAGWLGCGVVAIIPGVIFSKVYDTAATSEFREEAELSYGRYAAAKILEELGRAETNRATHVTPPPPENVGAGGSTAGPSLPSTRQAAGATEH